MEPIREKKVFFVSRQMELEKLHHLFNLALLSRPQIVLVPGLSGQGKTVLIRQFLAEVQEARLKQVVTAIGVGSNPLNPFHLWYEALGFALNSDSDVAGEPANLMFDTLKTYAPRILTKVVSSLTNGWIDVAIEIYHSVREILDAIRANTVKRGARLFTAEDGEKFTPAVEASMIQRQLDRFMHDRGLALLFFLDDLQWADDSSLALIQQFLQLFANSRNQAYPMILFLAYRSNEVRIPRQDGSFHPLRSLELELMNPKYSQIVTSLFGQEGGLPANPPGISVQEYSARRYRRHAFSLQMLDSLQQATRGEAIFVNELFNLWEKTGIICRNRSDRTWIFRGILNPYEHTSAENVVEAQIKLLNQRELEILTRASVDAHSDEIFIQQVIAATLDGDQRGERCDISAEIRSLRDGSQVIEAAAGAALHAGYAVDLYRFRHALIREITYQRFLEPETRRRFHCAIARAMEACFANDLTSLFAELGQHYMRGGEYVRSAVYFLRLLEQQIGQNQNAEAQSVFACLQELAGLAKKDASAAEINFALRLGEALLASTHSEAENAPLYGELGVYNEKVGIQTPGLRARYYRAFCSHLALIKSPNPSLILKAIDEFMLADEPEACLNLLKEAADNARSWSLTASVLSRLNEVERWLNSHGHWQKFACKFLLARAQFLLNEPYGKRQARQIREQAVDVARRTGDDEQLFEAMLNVALSYANTGDLERSLALRLETLKFAREAGRVDWNLKALNLCQSIYCKLAREAEWEDYASQWIHLAENVRALTTLGEAWNDYGFGLSHFGRKREAIEAYRKSGEIRVQLGHAGAMIWKNNVAALHAALGQFEEAQQEFEELRQYGFRNCLYGRSTMSLHHLGHVAYRQWRLKEALGLYNQSLAMCSGETKLPGATDTYWSGDRTMLLLTDLALVYARLGDFPAAFRALEKDKIMLEAEPSSDKKSTYQQVQGYVIGLSGNNDGGLPWLEKALAQYQTDLRRDQISLTQLYIAEISIDRDPNRALELARASKAYAEKEGVYWLPDACLVIAQILKECDRVSEAQDILGQARDGYAAMQIFPRLEYVKSLLGE